MSPILLLALLLLIGLIGSLFLVGRRTRPALPAEAQADRIVIEKARHRLTLYQGQSVIREYQVSIGRGGMGRKRQEGDRLTPEGSYRLESRNAGSDYHRALKVSYPDAADVAAAQARGVSAGSEIMIHGLRNGFGWLGTWHRQVDWTLGCIALTNAEIEEIWRSAPDGTPIDILP